MALCHPHPPPHQVLVRKGYGDKAKRAKQRNWQLQMMDREMDVTMATANQEGAEQDYQEFLEDLEEDMGYRKNVNIYFSEWNPAMQRLLGDEEMRGLLYTQMAEVHNKL